MTELLFSEAILQATDQLMAEDPAIYLMGLGVPDPKGLFGTTKGLQQKYGASRVLDMPLSENALTGVAIGSALAGMRPIMTHQRVDFFLLALDQLINNAAKWHYMFGGLMHVPLVIRLIIGRGWGQGPQHSQTLQSYFAHIPGLKVVMPATAYDAKGLLVAAVRDPHPVIYLEHRWLHGIYGEVPEALYEVPLGTAKLARPGRDVTLLALSHMTLEAHRAADWLEEEGISVEIVDIRCLKPLDKEMICHSVRKTGYALIADPDWKSYGASAELMALLVEELFKELKAPPQRITYPDQLVSTSWAVSNPYYPTYKDLILAILKMLDQPVTSRALTEKLLALKLNDQPLDLPDASFTGPF